jgi:hypothetical protein
VFGRDGKFLKNAPTWSNAQVNLTESDNTSDEKSTLKLDYLMKIVNLLKSKKNPAQESLVQPGKTGPNGVNVVMSWLMDSFAEETGTGTETTCVKMMLLKETVYQAMPPDDLIPMETLLMFTDKSILTLKTIILSSAGVCMMKRKPKSSLI